MREIKWKDVGDFWSDNYRVIYSGDKKSNKGVKYTGCNRRNGPDFGRVFLMLNYTENPKTPISKVEQF